MSRITVPALLAVLAALGTSTHGAHASALPPVRGIVYLDANGNGNRDRDERGLAQVAVSNQFDVALTDANGGFELPGPGPAGLVFVSIPDGYAARTWFARAVDTDRPNGSTIAFALTATPRTAVTTFVHASDTHLAEASRPRTARLRALIDSIQPAFVLVTGDLVRDALRVGEAEASGYFALVQDEFSKIRPPVWTVPGNHEIFGIERDKSGVPPANPLYGRAMYRHHRGPDYYSFNAGGVHFVGLNTVDIDDTRYYGHVDSVQLAWLSHDLAAVPSTVPVVTFNHIPFISAMESVRGLNENPPAPTIISVEGKAQFRHTVANMAEVLARLKGHPYPLALAGHVHVRERLRYEGTPTRFEQAAAVVGPSPVAGLTLTSGITVYRIEAAQIDTGRFVPITVARE